MNRAPNLRLKQDHPHTEQIDCHPYFRQAPDLFPSLFHLFRPVNISDHPYRIGMGVGETLAEVGHRPRMGMVSVEVEVIELAQLLQGIR